MNEHSMIKHNLQHCFVLLKAKKGLAWMNRRFPKNMQLPLEVAGNIIVENRPSLYLLRICETRNRE